MNMKEIKTKNDIELDEYINEKRADILAERLKDSQSRKGSVIKQGRREIARALTEKTQREKGESASQGETKQVN